MNGKRDYYEILGVPLNMATTFHFIDPFSPATDNVFDGGFTVDSGTGNTLSGNTASGNFYNFLLTDNASGNTLSGNTITGTSNSYAVMVSASPGNLISGNAATCNGGEGFTGLSPPRSMAPLRSMTASQA